MTEPVGTRRVPDLSYEEAAWASGWTTVAGVDEAGRGALAGPVVAGAVVLDRKRIPPGINDSKRLTKRQREDLYQQIVASAAAYAVASVEPSVIDQINILQASLAAMRHALECIADTIDYVLVDGNATIPGWKGAQLAVIDGDALSLSIAASSILAKVERDRIMAAYDATWPGYGFLAHSGYGTLAHRRALARLGPCPIHRRSFRGVATPDLFVGID